MFFIFNMNLCNWSINTKIRNIVVKNWCLRFKSKNGGVVVWKLKGKNDDIRLTQKMLDNQ